MEQEVALLTELMQSLTADVAELKKLVVHPPQPAPQPDIRPSLEKVVDIVKILHGEVKSLKQPPTSGTPIDFEFRFEALSQQIRQRPEYRLSQYVQYGGYVFGLLVIVLMGMSWLAFEWKSERDEYQPAYEQANWRVRYTKQANADFYAYMEGVFAKDAPTVQKWTLEQEEADQKRELARQAAEQAQAMNAQADRLEGKADTKGKKKERQ